ncbi:disease resistance protein RPV1-like [Apium graveolens]|uniref:disease resistance protein RPV1-like n=1 Tax=Apium graveolens TaxID=4045 RepID=UPI003D792EA3
MANVASSFCHVFLSFEGETRNNFTCFLYEALKAQGFVAFMDTNDVHIGDEVDLTIKEGIRNSMSAIVIFSQKYAYSTWCLDELVLILERKKNSRYFIIPILYEVEIGDIKHQLGNYGLALEEHRATYSHKVDKWREALVEAGNILGDHVKRLQSTFIQNIVTLFQEKLSAKFPESRLPMSKSSVLPSSSSSSFSRHGPFNDEVILYTTGVNNGLGANGLVKTILMSGNVVFKERNCSKEPKYLTELQELAGKDKVRLPMVIVNGKDLCGEEEVEGLEDFQDIVKLKSTLNILYAGQRQQESINDIMRTTSSIFGWDKRRI